MADQVNAHVEAGGVAHLMDDGENRAVRAFLMQYGVSGLTVGAMRTHMNRCGFPMAPEWAREQDREYLTKAGAQQWLRHLFALEAAATPRATHPQQEKP